MDALFFRSSMLAFGMEKRHFNRDEIERKFRMVDELFRFAYETKRFQLRQKFPHLSEREINHKAYALIEKGCS